MSAEVSNLFKVDRIIAGQIMPAFVYTCVIELFTFSSFVDNRISYTLNAYWLGQYFYYHLTSDVTFANVIAQDMK